jgi:hypothetical protein
MFGRRSGGFHRDRRAAGVAGGGVITLSSATISITADRPIPSSACTTISVRSCVRGCGRRFLVEVRACILGVRKSQCG